MTTISLHISITFICVVIATTALLFKASNKSKWVLIACLLWLTLQAVITFTGFYFITDTIPPRLILLLGPPMFFILIAFITKKGRRWIDSIHIKTLLWIHVLRIPVEMVLLWLFLDKLVPQLITFEGRNFDIISGITTPFIVWMLHTKWKYSKTIFLIWNFICLALVLNVVTHAIFAIPSPFQKFSFDQPNIGIFYFPITWLPGFVVPVVIFAHLVGIRRAVNNTLEPSSIG